MIFVIGETVPVICKGKEGEFFGLVTSRQRHIQFLSVSKCSLGVSFIVSLPCVMKGGGTVFVYD